MILITTNELFFLRLAKSLVDLGGLHRRFVEIPQKRSFKSHSNGSMAELADLL